MAKHLVKCKYCGEKFDANIEPFVKPSSNRYAHQQCHDNFLAEQEKIKQKQLEKAVKEEQKKKKEEPERKDLYDYLDKLFKGTCDWARIGKTIKQFQKDYGYTYSGIKKALIYFYEVKGNSIEKANGNISIVPYVYKQAFDYYYSIWEAKQKNENKQIEEYLPKEKVIIINPPERKIQQQKFFTFLDEEETE